MNFKEITRFWDNFLIETQRPGPGHQQTTYEKRGEVIEFDGWGGACYDATGERGEVVEDMEETEDLMKKKREKTSIIKRKGKKDILLGSDSGCGPISKTIRIKKIKQTPHKES